MEKEILQKIYLLRKVKPNASWEERTKQNILERDTVSGERRFADVLTTLVFQNRLAVMGAFVFLLVFSFLAFPLFPIDYGYEVVYLPPVERVEEKEEELKMVAEENEMVVDVAEGEETIERRYSALEESLVSAMRVVLGNMVENGDEESRQRLTDKEIIDYHIAKIEGESEDDVGMMVMSIEETEEDERLEMVKTARDNEDYGEAFDLLVDILAEQ